ncbi:FAD:protein FMN transferase [Parahaliea maris]|nr:FAD:protein FMN transferase [Parahaliea maris]
MLGTFVEISVTHFDPPSAQRAIDEAFTEIDTIHRLMSFHRPGSDIARLNQCAHRGPVRVDPRTYDVLECALEISTASSGIFDVSIGNTLAAEGHLPRHDDWPAAHPMANFRDILLLANGEVEFSRALWVDLGGIAKGYAVDRAAHILTQANCLDGRVNAGGEIRVFGERQESVCLRVPNYPATSVPTIELERGGLASSACNSGQDSSATAGSSAHRHGISRRPLREQRFASVVNERCMIADALTKVVLALGAEAEPILEQFRAASVMYDSRSGWIETGQTT